MGDTAYTAQRTTVVRCRAAYAVIDRAGRAARLAQVLLLKSGQLRLGDTANRGPALDVVERGRCSVRMVGHPRSSEAGSNCRQAGLKARICRGAQAQREHTRLRVGWKRQTSHVRPPRLPLSGARRAQVEAMVRTAAASRPVGARAG